MEVYATVPIFSLTQNQLPKAYGRPLQKREKITRPIIKAIKTANVLSYKSKEFSNAKPYPKDKE
jgi:hypothetical protein